MTTIDQVVRASIAEQGYKNLRKYILFLHFAFDALFKLKRDNIFIGFRFISLTVTNRRAVIPSTVLAMGQIGWQRGVRIIPFAANPNLSIDPAAAPTAMEVLYFNSNCHGLTYRIDRTVTPAEIVFDRQPKDNKVYVEVIDQTDTPNTETIVTTEGILPMKSYIAFRNSRFKLGAASAESKEAEREYLDEMDEAVASQSDLTPAGIYRALKGKEISGMMGLYPFRFGHFY